MFDRDKQALYKALQDVDDYIDDHAHTWPDWKLKLVIKKVGCLQSLIAQTDRRTMEGSK